MSENVDVILTDTNSIIINVAASPAVEIVTQGLQGTPGIPGPPGASYLFTQNSPVTLWTVNHNLGFVPSVTLYTTGGQEMDAEIVHVSNNQCLVYFISAQAGTARCV